MSRPQLSERVSSLTRRSLSVKRNNQHNPILSPFYCLQYCASQSFHTQIIVLSPYIEVFVIKWIKHCDSHWFRGREIVSLTTRVECQFFGHSGSECDQFWVLSLTRVGLKHWNRGNFESLLYNMNVKKQTYNIIFLKAKKSIFWLLLFFLIEWRTGHSHTEGSGLGKRAR